MSLLSQVRKGRKVAPRRVLLYGVQGIGKTTWGASAPNAIILPTEEGSNDIDCAALPLVTSFEQAIAALSELYSEQHNYQTLVVDSLDWLETLIWAKVCRAKCVSSIEECGYGKGYVFALEYWRQFLDGLGALREARGMSIILIAHAKIEKFQNPETDDYDRYMPRLHKAAAHVLQEWCDEVLFATYKVYVKNSEQGFGRTVAKGVGGTDRIIRTTERPAAMAKNRLNLPDELPLIWDAYAQYLTPTASAAFVPTNGANANGNS